VSEADRTDGNDFHSRLSRIEATLAHIVKRFEDAVGAVVHQEPVATVGTDGEAKHEGA
jgi:hypothetical protein